MKRAIYTFSILLLCHLVHGQKGTTDNIDLQGLEIEEIDKILNSEKNKKINLLDDNESTRYESQIKELETKFKASILIAKRILSEGEKLKTQWETLKIYSDFSRLANPNNYEEYTVGISQLKEVKLKGAGITLPDLSISNPLLSAGYSLVGTIFGKKGNNDVFQKIAPVIEQTAQFNNDLRLIDQQIRFLSNSSSSLIYSGLNIFDQLAKSVEYKDGYEGYKKNEGKFQELVRTFFDQEMQKGGSYDYEVANSIRLTNMLVNLTFVTNYIANYEQLLNDGLGYYNTFIEILDQYVDDNNPLKSEKGDFSSLQKKIENTKIQYSKAYESVVSRDARLRFYFGIVGFAR